MRSGISWRKQRKKNNVIKEKDNTNKNKEQCSVNIDDYVNPYNAASVHYLNTNDPDYVRLWDVRHMHNSEHAIKSIHYLHYDDISLIQFTFQHR